MFAIVSKSLYTLLWPSPQNSAALDEVEDELWFHEKHSYTKKYQIIWPVSNTELYFIFAKCSPAKLHSTKANPCNNIIENEIFQKQQNCWGEKNIEPAIFINTQYLYHELPQAILVSIILCKYLNTSRSNTSRDGNMLIQNSNSTSIEMTYSKNWPITSLCFKFAQVHMFGAYCYPAAIVYPYHIHKKDSLWIKCSWNNIYKKLDRIGLALTHGS